MKVTQNFVFFYGNTSCFSNFLETAFLVNGIAFCCGEQFIMYSKAMLFKDYEIADKIMLESSPQKMKALGRKVKDYDDGVWASSGERLTYIGLLAKFQQNEKLKLELLDTGNRELVEASPRDRVWGIGMGVTNKDIEDKTKWKGRNILGKILMRVRDHIASETMLQNAFKITNQ